MQTYSFFLLKPINNSKLKSFISITYQHVNHPIIANSGSYSKVFRQGKVKILLFSTFNKKKIGLMQNKRDTVNSRELKLPNTRDLQLLARLSYQAKLNRFDLRKAYYTRLLHKPTEGNPQDSNESNGSKHHS